MLSGHMGSDSGLEGSQWKCTSCDAHKIAVLNVHSLVGGQALNPDRPSLTQALSTHILTEPT